jgi:purine-binding chemotaxis protein CheW
MRARDPHASLGGEYLTFTLGAELYALPISAVREVTEYIALTPVPGVPSSIRGVVNLRGTVVPVVDLSAKFGFPASEVTQWTCLVIVDTAFDAEETLVAIVADTVDDVIELGNEDVLSPPTFGTRVHIDYLLALGKVGDGFVLILDSGRLLTLDEILSISPPPLPREERAP